MNTYTMNIRQGNSATSSLRNNTSKNIKVTNPLNIKIPTTQLTTFHFMKDLTLNLKNVQINNNIMTNTQYTQIKLYNSDQISQKARKVLC